MRNMNDEMIKLLAENGGVMLINFGSSFLSKESQDKYDQLNERLSAYRNNNNLSENDPEYLTYAGQLANELNVYEDVKTVADHIDHVVKIAGVDYVGFGSDFDGVGDSLPIGLKDVSMFPNLIFELLKRGYSEEDIEKICSGNTFRVWNKVAEIASELQKES